MFKIFGPLLIVENDFSVDNILIKKHPSKGFTP